MFELLPCPFCGETPEVFPSQNRGFYITCENLACVINPETRRVCDTTELAMAEWNTRPAPTPQPA